MIGVSRSRVVLFSLSLAFAAISLAGCRNRKEEARQRAELTQALQQFQTQIAELQKQVAGAHARFDALPEDLPGTETVRGDLLAVEEVLGVESGRTQWLSGELEKAFASGKPEEIEKVRSAIPSGTEGMAKSVMKVTHDVIPLERLAAQRRFFQELDAANAAKAADAGKAASARKERRPGAR